jgi:predicted HicB family RNase H-like nuclease
MASQRKAPQAKRLALSQLKISIPAELHRQLKVHAAETGIPMNAIVTTALTARLKNRGAL